MNKYLVVTERDEDVERDLYEGDAALLQAFGVFEKGRANYEVFILEGAVNPLTTDVNELFRLAGEVRARKDGFLSELRGLTKFMQPNWVVIVDQKYPEVGFGDSEEDALTDFIGKLQAKRGSGFTEEEIWQLRDQISLTEYVGLGVDADNRSIMHGTDPYLNKFFSELVANQASPRLV